MKIKFLIFISFLFPLLNVFCIDFEFIQIYGNTVIIGNDEFKYKTNIFWDEAEKEKLAGKWLYPYKEHEVSLTDYCISKYEITNKDFKLFLDAVNKKLLIEKEHDKKMIYWDNIRKNSWENPVKNISVFEALAYCQWLSDTKGNVYRLPTSAEWEYAAMGTEKMKYPWGNDQIILKSLETNEKTNPDDFPIGKIPENISPFGIMGMYGKSEIVLDMYNNDHLNSYYASINPLYLLSEDATFTARGSGLYNDFDNYAGLYSKTWSSFGSWLEQSFRIVEDKGTVFNKGTNLESVFFQSQGVFQNTIIYSFPSKEESELVDIKQEFEKCLILLKYQKDKNIWYRVYYPKEGEYGIEWFSGWVEASDVQLIEDKWYENVWDWYQSQPQLQFK